jgi:putative phosphoribosyl transferase
MIFRDRCDAGEQLAARLSFLKNEPDLIVLGIPRGGVVVAAEIARALNAPLDVFMAHKIGAPFNPELAIGALTESGDVWLDQVLIDQTRSNPNEIKHAVDSQRLEISGRTAMFRAGLAPLEVAGKKVVLVDDGVATGSTVLVSLRMLRSQSPARLILAIPVGPAETVEMLAGECDQAVVLSTPEPFWAVGRFYASFDQTSDKEVIALLNTARRCHGTQPL